MEDSIVGGGSDSVLAGNGMAADVGTLKAGAARVEITPDANAIPRPFTSIHDPLYARAIYLDNGSDRALLLNADVGGMSTAITDKVSGEISKALNIPAANILISATHDHNAIFGGPRPPGPGGSQGTATGPADVFQTKLESGLVQAAQQAHDRMQPARIGYGTGNLYLNANRDAIDDQTRLWTQEPNLELSLGQDTCRGQNRVAEWGTHRGLYELCDACKLALSGGYDFR